MLLPHLFNIVDPVTQIQKFKHPGNGNFVRPLQLPVQEIRRIIRPELIVPVPAKTVDRFKAHADGAVNRVNTDPAQVIAARIPADKAGMPQLRRENTECKASVRSDLQLSGDTFLLAEAAGIPVINSAGIIPGAGIFIRSGQFIQFPVSGRHRGVKIPQSYMFPVHPRLKPALHPGKKVLLFVRKPLRTQKYAAVLFPGGLCQEIVPYPVQDKANRNREIKRPFVIDQVPGTIRQNDNVFRCHVNVRHGKRPVPARIALHAEYFCKRLCHAKVFLRPVPDLVRQRPDSAHRLRLFPGMPQRGCLIKERVSSLQKFKNRFSILRNNPVNANSAVCPQLRKR